MSLVILGIGTATPPRSIAQADAAALALAFANAEPGRERTLAAIYRQTRINSRSSVLLEDPGDAAFAQSFFPPATHGDDCGPTTAERMARYALEAGPLAVAAARTALANAGTPAASVTHLVTCSCTGFVNPGVDLDLVRGLGLRDSVARVHVGFMGCHGAFNALAVAAAFTAADPDVVVLVACVELCSLHFRYGTGSDHVVANSIFADGAAALVAVGERGPQPRGIWQLLGRWSRVLPDSADQMGWVIGDHGFEMSLSARVPDAIAEHLPRLVDTALESAGLAREAVGSWAVHPGGPRVLASVAAALGLASETLAASHAVLAEHGNMSSATILFILERMMRQEAAGPCAAMAFGPGLTAELALFGVVMDGS
jgi:predicted naringenin-chalcone synthase